MSPLHGLWKTLAASRTHLLATHLEPTRTGQPPCSMDMSERPDRRMLCQKTAELRSGLTATPRRGKAVRPPRGI